MKTKWVAGFWGTMQMCKLMICGGFSAWFFKRTRLDGPNRLVSILTWAVVAFRMVPIFGMEEIMIRTRIGETKTRSLRRCTVTVLLLAGLSPLAPAATIILVRHAERNAGMTPDVLLSPRGEERARELARVLKDANIRAVFATEVRRTQQTAEPTAKEFHLQPTVIPAKDVDTLVSRLQALPDDETVLVVGHANTVPLIVERLGGTVPAMSDTEYDRLVVAATKRPGKPAILTLRYGALTH
jgi:phosphohistidine phosphatase SixA